jgi:hypothetical protein
VVDVAERMTALGVRAIGLPAVMHALAGVAGQNADASVASRPRLTCTPKGVSVAVLLTCTHCTRPATRTPVSSWCSTGALWAATMSVFFWGHCERIDRNSARLPSAPQE